MLHAVCILQFKDVTKKCFNTRGTRGGIKNKT